MRLAGTCNSAYEVTPFPCHPYWFAAQGSKRRYVLKRAAASSWTAIAAISPWLLPYCLTWAEQALAAFDTRTPSTLRVKPEREIIAQSAHTQNATLLSKGAEARDGMAGSLILERNTLVNDAGPETRFVHVWAERLAGDTPATMPHNLFVGPGQLDLPPQHDAGGNRRLVNASTAPQPR